METIAVNSISRSREDWISYTSLPAELRSDVMSADVLIVPSLMADQPKAFMAGTMELFAFLKSQLGDRIEICISDDDYIEIELNSRTLRLGRFWVKSVALTLFLNVLGNYIYDRIKQPDPVVIEINAPEFQQASTIDFTLAVEDTLGKKKEFHYEGSAADYKEVSEEIERLWNEE